MSGIITKNGYRPDGMPLKPKPCDCLREKTPVKTNILVEEVFMEEISIEETDIPALTTIEESEDGEQTI